MSTRVSEAILQDVLRRASDEERLALTQAIQPQATRPLEANALEHALGRAAGHGVINALRGKGVSYAELLSDAVDTLEIKDAPRYFRAGELGISVASMDSDRAQAIAEQVRIGSVKDFVDQLERKLLSKLMTVAYERATPAQRKAIDAQLRLTLASSKGTGLKGLSTGAALLAIGNLGGFATYTVASSVLSALSLGTLGFGAYTFASSAISVLLGPAGWLALGLAAVVKLGGPDKAQVVRLAATCALTAQRIKKH